jgi:hypothetical protein
LGIERELTEKLTFLDAINAAGMRSIAQTYSIEQIIERLNQDSREPSLKRDFS